MILKRILLFAIGAIFYCCSLMGQENEQANSLTLDDLLIDFAIPDLSAINMLSIDEENIVQPGTIRELAVSVPAFFTEEGEFAIEIAPVLLFYGEKGKDRSVNEYDKKLLKGLQLSAATVKDGNGRKGAFGIKYSFNCFDALDLSNNKGLQQEIQKELAGVANKIVSIESVNDLVNHKILPLYTDPDPTKNDNLKIDFLPLKRLIEVSQDQNDWQSDPEKIKDRLLDSIKKIEAKKQAYKELRDKKANDKQLEEIVGEIAQVYALIINESKTAEESLKTRIDDIKKKYENEYWNAIAIDFGLGVGFTSVDDADQGLQRDNLTAFTSFKFPSRLGGNGMGIFHLQYNSYEVVTTTEATEMLTDTVKSKFFAGFEWQQRLFKRQDRRLTLQAIYAYEDYNDNAADPDNYNIRLTAGLEFKIAKNLWFEGGIGGEWSGNSDGRLVGTTKAAYAFGPRKKKDE